MASAIISETIRPSYIWTGSEWVQIGDGGGGGGSAVNLTTSGGSGRVIIRYLT